MIRRHWIQTAFWGSAAVSTCGVVYARTEPAWFDVSRTSVRLPKLAAPCRALHLADLHSSPSVPTHLLRQAVETGLRKKPEVVFLTGDYITHWTAFDEAGLRNIFRTLAAEAPVLAVMGNHDFYGDHDQSTGVLRQLLREGGVQVLLNESTTVRLRSGQDLSVAGTGDLWNRSEFQPHRAFDEVDTRLPVILLAHNPDTKDSIGGKPWDLMLSGHTHGGQVVLPGVHPYWAPVRDQRFIAGLYRWRGGRQIYITRGVGSRKVSGSAAAPR